MHKQRAERRCLGLGLASYPPEQNAAAPSLTGDVGHGGGEVRGARRAEEAGDAWLGDGGAVADEPGEGGGGGEPGMTKIGFENWVVSPRRWLFGFSAP